MKKNFTLIELLMVVAIIGVLAGILLPALARSKKMAHRATCTGQMRQLGIVCQNYIADYDYVVPLADYNVKNSAGGSRKWYQALGEYMGWTTNNVQWGHLYWPNRNGTPGKASIFVCPSMKFENACAYLYVYLWRPRWQNGQYYYEVTDGAGLSYKKVKKPSVKLLAWGANSGDVRFVSGYSKYDNGYASARNTAVANGRGWEWYDGMHDGRNNQLHVDGHVECRDILWQYKAFNEANVYRSFAKQYGYPGLLDR